MPSEDMRVLNFQDSDFNGFPPDYLWNRMNYLQQRVIDAFTQSERCNIKIQTPDWESLVREKVIDEVDRRAVFEILEDQVKWTSWLFVRHIFASLARFFDRKGPRSDWTEVEAEMRQAILDLASESPLEERIKEACKECFEEAANMYWPTKSFIDRIEPNTKGVFNIHSSSSIASHRIEVHLSLTLEVKVVYKAIPQPTINLIAVPQPTFNLLEIEGMLDFEFPLVAEADTVSSDTTTHTIGGSLTKNSIFRSLTGFTSASAINQAHPRPDSKPGPASMYSSGSAGAHEEMWSDWYPRSLRESLEWQ
ncbi:hypothetical protein HD553DRAFT_325740 [Filobasidium floriforme]|uniref:uncharacterized protein n=1 Tax=Filobasidium floriforme TaxID=5210 RepID=UPI001E8DD5F0|nr:uncharacterized protein HD553DRAFT_325740 [Filobasidium floriforme]KAH8080765.1 hypothetical protein HD553DRAFT_325740 [Filobasidium floriforme]